MAEQKIGEKRPKKGTRFTEKLRPTALAWRSRDLNNNPNGRACSSSVIGDGGRRTVRAFLDEILKYGSR